MPHKVPRYYNLQKFQPKSQLFSLTVNAILVQEVYRHCYRRLHGVQVFGERGHHLWLEEPLLIPLWTLFWQSQSVEEGAPAMTE